MLLHKKLLWIILVFTQIILYGVFVGAAEPPQRPDNFEADFPVYFSSANENRINLSWTASEGADFYILNITTDTNWAGQTISEEKQIKGLSYIDIRQNSLSSPTTGTVFKYKLYSAVYEKDAEGNPTDKYVRSTNYASLSVLTNPAVLAKPLSISEIKLIWDDIKCDGQSIDYEIVKFKKGVNVGQELIRVSEIGQSAIRVNGKLEYTIRNLDKSTEYTFQLHPLASSDIKFNPFVTITGATHISALIQRYNENIVKLMWDEYQGTVSATDLYYRVIEITQVNGQKSYQTIATPEVPYYYAQIGNGEDRAFLIEVHKKEGDAKVAESSELSLMDIVVPATPSVSALEYSVTNSSITLTWDTHKAINGERDTQVKYDLWLLTNPDDVDDLRAFYNPNNSGITDRRLASNLQISNELSSNPKFSLIKANNEYKYQYNITELLPNVIYYIGIVAKKTYIMQDPQNQELIITLSYTSEPIIETIRTTSGNLEQPVALVKPPGLSVRTDSQGKSMITQNSITIKWPLGQTINNMFVSSYEDDVYFRVGFEEYTPNFDKDKTNDDIHPNYNIHTQNVSIIREEEQAYATITELESNTAYVFWVKAYRDVQLGKNSVIKVSEASDPIIVVTLPDYTMPNIKPPVPSITVIDNIYKDKITVQFDSIIGLRYTIAWGIEDSISKKVGQKEYFPLSSLNSDSVIVDDLNPETTYYFWIMATNGTINSEWSDSAVGVTIAIPPPDPPRGFGIKRILQNNELVPDIGEHYIALQWDKEEGIEYIIEISKKDDFSNSENIIAGVVSDYKVEKFNGEEIKSNTRYWIRLFAKDTSTNKISQNSIYLTVKTKFNYDEYNSNQDIETPLEGKIASETVNGTTGIWSVDFSGFRGDRLIEKIRNQNKFDYNLDLSKTSVSGINKREILVPYKVINILSINNQNLVIKSDKAEFIFLPQALNLGLDEDDLIKIKIYTLPYSLQDDTNQLKTLSDISELEVFILNEEKTKIQKFSKPIKIILSYKNNNLNGIVNAYYLKLGELSWDKVENVKTDVDDKLYLVLYSDGCGRYCVKKQIPDTSQLKNYIYKKEINELLSTDLMKSVNSNNIKPSYPIVLGDAVKMLLDSCNDNYHNNYMDVGEKSGLLSVIYNSDSLRYISREEAVSMVIRLYEIKTGEELPQIGSINTYSDAEKVNYVYKKYIGNALKMGIFTPANNYIRPKDLMTRGEMLAMINRLLHILGKL